MSRFHSDRRRFFGCSAAALASLAVTPPLFGAETKKYKTAASLKSSYSCDGRVARIYSDSIKEPIKLLQISDSHLFLDDERGDEFKQYSDRMSKAYNNTKHFLDGRDTNPTEMFAEIAENAKDENYDAVVLTGDIVSFPSSAGVEYAKSKLETIGAPYYYVCGNHDWHFEGMEGTERDLRDEWIEKKLKPMYVEGVDPLCYAVKVKGLKILMIDDSIYEILPKQLEFIRRELAEGLPTIACMHIPLYAPGRRVAYGVGHPEWNAEHDGIYQIERRLQWPKDGHKPTTYAFRNELLAAPNLLAVFTGHIHTFTLDLIGGKPSNVTRAALDGSSLKIEILPYPVA